MRLFFVLHPAIMRSFSVTNIDDLFPVLRPLVETIPGDMGDRKRSGGWRERHAENEYVPNGRF